MKKLTILAIVLTVSLLTVLAVKPARPQPVTNAVAVPCVLEGSLSGEIVYTVYAYLEKKNGREYSDGATVTSPLVINKSVDVLWNSAVNQSGYIVINETQSKWVDCGGGVYGVHDDGTMFGWNESIPNLHSIK